MHEVQGEMPMPRQRIYFCWIKVTDMVSLLYIFKSTILERFLVLDKLTPLTRDAGRLFVCPSWEEMRDSQLVTERTFPEQEWVHHL